ncbi:SIR2 family protein [Roseomonas fluvialis]|uniref:NACHT domain-containing protein n=1 Tax=Roseomonas fluvialis TaxID=1750527 RepID=A0ABN6P6H3_9PROT|nr:SIR2 family protein [Roseomonas fluvialis]BDG72905.1 hypothetical protein Rmf_28340 [Roseomonas fluvialis]
MTIESIRQSAKNGNLIVVFGAGASIALNLKSKIAPSWPSLVKSGLDYALARALINEEQVQRYSSAATSGDIDDMLGAAEFVGRKLGAPRGDAYARWMKSVFEGCEPEEGGMYNAVRAIFLQKIPIATLNYDSMMEMITGVSPADFSRKDEILAWLRREREAIFHIHGIWSNPSDCIFGIRDYHDAIESELRALVQRSMGVLNRLLFIGCGETFGDPNFHALITWLRENVGAGAPQHYALVRNSEVGARLADPVWRGFVEPLGYGDAHADLPGYILNCFPTQHASTPSRSRARAGAAAAAVRHSQTINAYQRFLLRDCGEMTIEGMRADMETAQRKFDLERLFVPLQLQAFAAKEAVNDVEHDIKLQNKKERNKVESFSRVFFKEKKIALLALPGGGKTLLLKRLAVAYSDRARLTACPDKLPEIDLVPVMIRCREWKDHIRKPIPELLRNLAMITGDPSVDGLYDALERPLKAGSVLLLVDGLDEIHSDADRAIFSENLEKFLEFYPKIRFVVTSREAGFDLVAPCLTRFCVRYRIAPLSVEAVKELSGHWHRLMGGDSPESLADAAAVADTLLENDALRRLSENPLLLTMLLVVKHGAGRLPPDRVSLYDRAVEVLLDTWNIKGHDALNVKEAVPLLACLAFELMRRGAQTATEFDILKILEEARIRLPMVGRYAKDSPHEFLKRVELRSSLLVEGGYRSEGGKTVPFYQFRHLTFQEYLAAVAAVEGYTLIPGGKANPLANIGENLIADEWKEVIPMAAVLARAQAEELLNALTIAAEHENSEHHKWHDSLVSFEPKLPPATARLAQAMVEEAMFTPKLLARATRHVAFFASGCRSNDNWQALSRGPYGPDLRRAAIDVYLQNDGMKLADRLKTAVMLEAYVANSEDWRNADAESVILDGLSLTQERKLVESIIKVAAAFSAYQTETFAANSVKIYQKLQEKLFHKSVKISSAAAWAWGYWRHLQSVQNKKRPIPDNRTLLRLLELYVGDDFELNGTVRPAVRELVDVPRIERGLRLSDRAREKIREEFQLMRMDKANFGIIRNPAIVRVAFIMPEMFSDSELKELLIKHKSALQRRSDFHDVFSAMGIELEKRPRR